MLEIPSIFVRLDDLSSGTLWVPLFMHSEIFCRQVLALAPAGRGYGSSRGQGSQDHNQGRVTGTFLRPQALTVSGGEAGLSSVGLEEEENKDAGWCGLWAADTQPQRARQEMRWETSTSDHFPGARLTANP